MEQCSAESNHNAGDTRDRWILRHPEKQEQNCVYDIDFHSINSRAQQFGSFLRSAFDDYVSILLEYETFEVAEDELLRSTDLFNNLSENATYFKKKVGAVATFLPRNQPLYALSCFSLVPSLMSTEVHVWAPRIMHSFFFKLIEKLRIDEFFPNVQVFRKLREEFVEQRRQMTWNSLKNEYEPMTDVVIFTGTQANADKMRPLFSSRTLFVANGSGHNPVIISDNANVDSAVKSILRLKLYNQGQDCAAPNSILVHRSIYDHFLCHLRFKMKTVKIGPYSDRETRIGPISDPQDLKRIQSVLVDNFKWLDASTPGIIRTGQSIVEPTLILKPLEAGGNFDEHFAPLLFIQKYNDDKELKIYFEDPKYAPNAMYVTVFGCSDYVNKNLMDLRLSDKRSLHTTATIIHDSDLHAPGVERGVQPYGGYGRGASSLSIYGVTTCKPTLVQRDIFEQLVLPTLRINATHPLTLEDNIDGILYSKKKSGVPLSIPLSNLNTLLNEGSHIDIARQLSVRYKTRTKLTCLIQIIPCCELPATKLREIIICSTIARELALLGINCSLIIQWCDMEPLESDHCVNGTNYVGSPIYKVPDIFNLSSSLSNRFLHEFRKMMLEFEIDYELKIQSAMYDEGMYYSYMVQLLLERDKYNLDNCPFKVYSKFTGTHNTRILSYESDKITYKCLDTGEVDTTHIDNRKSVILKRLFDLSVTWKIFDVQFVSSSLAFLHLYTAYYSTIEALTNQFNIPLPEFIEIKPVSIVNADNSTVQDACVRSVLAIYPVAILKYIYNHTEPSLILTIYFNKKISRHYDSFDATFSHNTNGRLLGSFLSFDQLLCLGEISMWNKRKLESLCQEQSFVNDAYSFNERICCIRFWQQMYSKDKPKRLLNELNLQYCKNMCKSRCQWIDQLKLAVFAGGYRSLKQLETIIRNLPKYPSIPFKIHCMDVYNLLLGEDTGPRLTTLLWVSNRDSIVSLLNVKNTNACFKNE